MNEPAPLPDDLLDYLDAAREPEATPSATKERLLARLGPFLPPIGGGGAPTDGGGGGGSPPMVDGGATIGGSAGSAAGSTAAAGTTATAVGATAALGQGKWIIATVSALLGAGGGAAMHATLAPQKTVTVVVSAPVVAGTAAAPLVDPAPSASVAPSAPPSEAPSVTASAPSPSGEPVGPRKSSLRAERILLEAANAALIRGDYAAALASLRQHARTYPKGELAQERDVLMAQATRLQQSDKVSSPR